MIVWIDVECILDDGDTDTYELRVQYAAKVITAGEPKDENGQASDPELDLFLFELKGFEGLPVKLAPQAKELLCSPEVCKKAYAKALDEYYQGEYHEGDVIW